MKKGLKKPAKTKAPSKEEPASLNLNIKPQEKTSEPAAANSDSFFSATTPPQTPPQEQPFFKTEVVGESPSFEKKEEVKPTKKPLVSPNDSFSLNQTPEKPANDLQIFEPEEKKKTQSPLKLLLLFILGFVLGGAAVFAFFFINPLKLSFLSQNSTSDTLKKEEAKTSPIPPTIETKTEEATASDETKEELDVSDLSLQILNGSGVAGAAARTRDTLKKDGFVTFTLGNAVDYEDASTEVKFKKDVKKEVFDLIEKALTDYDLVLTDENLSSDSEFDIEITLGAKK